MGKACVLEKMVNFYSEIKKRGLSSILRYEKYETPKFITTEVVRNTLIKLIKQNAKGLIVGDYDIDGLMCALIVSSSLRKMGATYVDIYHYTKRTHNLDKLAVQQCIQGKYDYIIICDTGSNDMSSLKLLQSYGISVIVLDHHNSVHSYEDFLDRGINIVNTTLEEQEYNLSAGALCYCVMDDVANSLGYDLGNIVAFATVSLFSDCMDMKSALNRAIYYKSTEIERGDLPDCLKLFMNDYTSFNARFINYWFSPRINAMFRSEYFEPLNILFFSNTDDAAIIGKCLEIINHTYEEIRELIKKVTDIIEVKELNNFVIGDLQSADRHYSVQENKLYNYTGLVANKLSERYSKPAIVLCKLDVEYKGSVRDIFGRDYLSMFSQLCFAGGHNSAFGIKVKTLDFDDFMCALYRIDNTFSMDSVKNEPIIIDYKYPLPDSTLFEDVARFNEFAGQTIPVILLRKQYIGAIKQVFSEYYFKYNWGEYTIQSNNALNFGTYILIKPIHSWCTKLLVQ